MLVELTRLVGPSLYTHCHCSFPKRHLVTRSAGGAQSSTQIHRCPALKKLVRGSDARRVRQTLVIRHHISKQINHGALPEDCFIAQMQSSCSVFAVCDRASLVKKAISNGSKMLSAVAKFAHRISQWLHYGTVIAICLSNIKHEDLLFTSTSMKI